MARTKKKGQKLGGQLQSARAKHDTALEEEILGKIAEKQTKDKKPPKVKKPKVKAVQDDEPTANGKKPSRKVVQVAKKEKRRERKKELIDVLASGLAIESNRAGELIKRANHQFTMSQMSRAAEALHKSSGGHFTEAEYMAKVAEFNGVDKRAEGRATKQKDAREAAIEQKSIQSGGGEAKKQQELTFKPVSSRTHEVQPSQRTKEAIKDKAAAMPSNGGFSMEFWMDLAGSRAAAAEAAM